MPQFADEVVGLLIRFLVVQFGGEESAPCPAEQPEACILLCYSYGACRASFSKWATPREPSGRRSSRTPIKHTFTSGPIIGMSHEVFADVGRTTNQRCFGIR